MAEQYSQASLFKPMVAASEALGKALPKKYTPTSSFSGVRDIATGKMSAPAMSVPADINKLGKITTPYGGSTAYEGSHPGVDIANVSGTKIPAFTGGKVTEVRTGQGWTPNTPSFGNYVVVQDENGNYHRYSHLQNSFVKVGDPITKGTVLGEMGGTGSTYGSTKGDQPGIHLDYRIWDAAKKYYNPFEYLGSYGK